MLASKRPRDSPAGLIKTMRQGLGRAIDAPVLIQEHIGLKDPLCLLKRSPEGRNKLKLEPRLLSNLIQGLSQNRCRLP